MPPFNRPREADTETITDPRRAALEGLAGLLRSQGFTANTEGHHLTAKRPGGRPVEVRCQIRADDGAVCGSRGRAASRSWRLTSRLARWSR